MNTDGIRHTLPRAIADSFGPTLPLDHFAELRRDAITPLGPHEWLVARHGECAAVLRGPQLSSNPRHVRDYERVKGRLPFADEEHVILTMDPPDHTRLRRLAARAFLPGTVAALEPWIRARAVDLLDGLGDDPVVDVVRCVAEPLPIAVIARLLDVDDDPRFARWGREMILGTMPALAVGADARERADRATEEVAALLGEAIADRRRAPGSDVLSALVSAEQGGDRLSSDELTVLCVTLLVAGFVTTVNLIGNGIALLAAQPDLIRSIRGDVRTVPTAVEEMLRLDGGTVAVTRFATADLALGGHRVERGDAVTALVASANRDPVVFDDPDRFDPRRPNAARHLNFGGGIHLCLGAPLARLEAAVLFEELLVRFDSIKIIGEPERASGVLRGYTALRARLGSA